MADKITRIIDADNAAEKRALLMELGALRGIHRVEWKAVRPSRSSRANAYYFGVVVTMFRNHLREQGWNGTIEDAHELIKGKLLRHTVINESTGEIIGEIVKSSASLDTTEFSDFLERAIQWLAEMFHIVVPPSSLEQSFSPPSRGRLTAAAAFES